MTTPRPYLFLKPGCIWCTEAEGYLQKHAIAYDKVDVYADPAAMDEMKRLSGQTKAPTMRWGDEFLADFGVEELDAFLRGKGVVK